MLSLEIDCLVLLFVGSFRLIAFCEVRLPETSEACVNDSELGVGSGSLELSRL